MKQNKHEMLSGDMIGKYILVFILILVLFNVIAALWPDIGTAGATLNASGFPLGEIFVSTGALWYLVAAGVIFLIYRSFKVSAD